MYKTIKKIAILLIIAPVIQPSISFAIEQESTALTEDGLTKVVESLETQVNTDNNLDPSVTEVVDKNSGTTVSESSTIESIDSSEVVSKSEVVKQKQSEKKEIPTLKSLARNNRLFNPEIERDIEALTEEQLKQGVGENGLGERENHSDSVDNDNKNRSGVNINQYIDQKKFKTPKIIEDPRKGTTPKYNFAKLKGVVVHETANPNSNIYGEVNYMFNNWQNAFVHAYASGNAIIETAPVDYLAWGAGKYANQYFLHIELVRAHSIDEFAKSVNNDAYWIAKQLADKGLTPQLADTNNGIGSVISHKAVSDYYGGTDHVDPIGYFASWGYDMKQFFQLIQKHYNNVGPIITNTKVDGYVSSDYAVYSGPIGYKDSKRIGSASSMGLLNKNVLVKKQAQTSSGLMYEIPGFGWIGAKGVTAYVESTINTEAFEGRVVESGYAIYNKPVESKGFEKIGDSSKWYKKDVKITHSAQTPKGLMYKMDGVGWIGSIGIEKYSKPKYQTVNFNVQLSVDDYAVYSQPVGYKGYQRIGSTKTFAGNDYQITRAATIKSGIMYEVPGIGWIGANGFKKYQSVNKKMALTADGYRIYTAPIGFFGSKWTTETTHKFVGQEFKIRRVADTSVGKMVEIPNVGWVGANGFKEYTNSNIKAYLKTASYKVHSMPVGLEGSHVTNENLDKHVGQLLSIKQTFLSKVGMMYEIPRLGWVGKNGFLEVTAVNESKKVNVKGYNIYSGPIGSYGAKRVKSIDGLYGKKVSIKYTAITSSGKMCYIENVGWVGYKAFN